MNRLSNNTQTSHLNDVVGDSPFTQYVKKGNELHKRYENGEISLESEPDDSDDFFKRLEEA